MDFQWLLQLLIILFISVTGLFYYFAFHKITIAPPESFQTFDEHYTNYLDIYADQDKHSIIKAKNEYKLN